MRPGPGWGDRPVATVHVIDHPLVQHKLTLMRSAETGPKEFRELLEEIAMLITYEATRGFPAEEVEVRTPAGTARGVSLAGKKVAVVPILRSGLVMVSGILRLMPVAKVGHVGIHRDGANGGRVTYYCKLPPDIGEREVIVAHPLVASGWSLCEAVQLLKERGARHIQIMALVAAPQGLQRLAQNHPDVDVYVAAVDQGLDGQGQVVPGLGDVGERLFGTP